MGVLDFSNNKIYIMGILNVTPDSFSDGGRYASADNALFHAEEMICEGADIIDIGGESTKPFSEPVSLQEELDRVMPVIEKINSNFKTIVSIDTYKSGAAREALRLGARIINDISGFTFDPEMENAALEYGACCIVMHIKGTPKNMQADPKYENVVKEVFDFLDERQKHLKQIGLEEVVVDPGFGFGKSLDDNYQLLKNLNEFKNMGCPVLAGISRKSMIGKVTGVPADRRLPGTIALNTIAILNGAAIIRVHDVKENFQAVKLLEKYSMI
jgi:dihydropteroate synthase